MDTNLDIIVAVIAACIFMVFIFLTRRTKTFKNFAVSDNSIGLFLIFMTFSATFIGPGFSMALVSEGNTSGFFYIIIAGFYGIAKIVEGSFFAERIRNKFSDALSIGDIIAGPISHNSKLLHLLTGIVSFGLLVGFSTVLSKAGGEVMNNFFGVHKTLGIIIMTSIIVVYSFFGGLKATILTDAFQFILFVFLIVTLLVILIFSSGVDTVTIFKTGKELTISTFNSYSFVQIFSLVITWFFGEMLIPPTVNRILSTKSSIISKKGLLYSGFFMIAWLMIMLFLGVISFVLLDVHNGDQILLDLGKDYFKFGLFGLFAVAVIGIVMSSQDSLLNSASIVFTKDIFNVFKKLPDKSNLILARIATILVGIFSIIFSLYMPSILSGLLFIYSLWAPAILIPLLASLFLSNQYWQAAVLSMLTGVIASVIAQHFQSVVIIPPILTGMAASLLGYYIMHQFLKSKRNV